MPTFLEGRKRNPWKGQVKGYGQKPEAAYFPTRPEASEWEEQRRRVRRRKSLGQKADIADLKTITVGLMVSKYIQEVTNYKASHVEEHYRLGNFLKYKDYSTRPLLSFTRADAVEYRNYLEREYVWTGRPYVRKYRGKQQEIIPKCTPKRIKAGTVRRIIATLKHMWNIAASDWKGYEGLKGLDDPNPWIKVSSSKTPRKRRRRLDDLPTRKNELQRLLEACKHCFGRNKIYLPLAINMAVQTGMRMQEILYLEWADINMKEFRIHIRKSKTDYKSDDEGRDIVLPLRVWMYLVELITILALTRKGDHSAFDHMQEIGFPHCRIFPMSKSAFKQAWKRIVKTAGIPSKEEDAARGVRESQCGLEFKDLRREAGSRFDEAELTRAEHDLMLGHDSAEIRDIYIAPYLDRIQKKLDSYWGKDSYHDPMFQQLMHGASIQDIMGSGIISALGIDVSQMIDREVNGIKFIKEDGLIKRVTVKPDVVEPTNVVPLSRTGGK